MTNKWNISDWLEEKVRRRDNHCVYCDIKLKGYPYIKGTPHDKATWEHINNNEKDICKWNITLCCASCNSSKGAKKLLDWFDAPFCKNKKINKKTVADIIKKYIKIISVKK
ncbi:MAG: hypothetical protein AUJ70_01870 [Candidatus Omnitrophica bacterium CG1_02_40_15]|nr:MAG: hypothetical protein AUJ70_01870 [Candidatus Omnitrophica bacterium CG1_02_40_15]